jgi:kinesin family protein 15
MVSTPILPLFILFFFTNYFLNNDDFTYIKMFILVADANTSQEDMFQLVGMPITQTCLEGFNGTILCYGQTGSGKSYTTFGSTDTAPESRGLVPRVLDFLWHHIGQAEDNVRYSCRCSFYEIYQERVFDLLVSKH